MSKSFKRSLRINLRKDLFTAYFLAFLNLAF